MRVAGFVVALVLTGCPSAREPLDVMDASDAAEEERVGRRDADPPADTGYEVFVDPGCDAGEPSEPPVSQCDPLESESCGPGAACYPLVAYPDGPCGEEVYVAYCAPEGTGGQGDSCDGTLSCRAGFTCFVTGAGNQCLQICDLSGGPPACPRGRICAATDHRDYGACY